MRNTTITVQSCGGDKSNFRFGLSTDESNKIRNRKVQIRFIINGIEFITKTTCGQWRINDSNEKMFYKGFDFYSKEISDYIKSQKLNDYTTGKPTTIKVDYEIL